MLEGRSQVGWLLIALILGPVTSDLLTEITAVVDAQVAGLLAATEGAARPAVAVSMASVVAAAVVIAVAVVADAVVSDSAVAVSLVSAAGVTMLA